MRHSEWSRCESFCERSNICRILTKRKSIFAMILHMICHSSTLAFLRNNALPFLRFFIAEISVNWHIRCECGSIQVINNRIEIAVTDIRAVDKKQSRRWLKIWNRNSNYLKISTQIEKTIDELTSNVNSTHVKYAFDWLYSNSDSGKCVVVVCWMNFPSNLSKWSPGCRWPNRIVRCRVCVALWA